MSQPPFPPSQGTYSDTGPYNAPMSKTSGMALTSMILGILAFPLICAFGFGVVIGLVALVLGIVSLIAINKDPARLSGKGFAITGIILGSLSMLIIGPLLIAILLPSLGKARELANRSVCAANLRGLSQSMNVYAADNNDAYPVVSPVGRYGLAGSGSPNVTENMWLLVSDGQVSPKQFLCKSDPAPVTPAAGTGSNFTSDLNYSYSIAYPWMTTPPSTKPGSTVPTNIGGWWTNATDASLPVIADMAPLNGTGSPAAATSSPTPNRLMNSFNHQRDGENVALGDAHVEFCRVPTIGQNSDNIYTTNGGTPSPMGTAFPGGVEPAIGNGGAPGAYDICMVPAADGTSHVRH